MEGELREGEYKGQFLYHTVEEGTFLGVVVVLHSQFKIPLRVFRLRSVVFGEK